MPRDAALLAALVALLLCVSATTTVTTKATATNLAISVAATTTTTTTTAAASTLSCYAGGCATWGGSQTNMCQAWLINMAFASGDGSALACFTRKVQCRPGMADCAPEQQAAGMMKLAFGVTTYDACMATKSQFDDALCCRSNSCNTAAAWVAYERSKGVAPSTSRPTPKPTRSSREQPAVTKAPTGSPTSSGIVCSSFRASPLCGRYGKGLCVWRANKCVPRTVRSVVAPTAPRDGDIHEDDDDDEDDTPAACPSLRTASLCRSTRGCRWNGRRCLLAAP